MGCEDNKEKDIQKKSEKNNRSKKEEYGIIRKECEKYRNSG